MPYGAPRPPVSARCPVSSRHLWHSGKCQRTRGQSFMGTVSLCDPYNLHHSGLAWAEKGDHPHLGAMVGRAQLLAWEVGGGGQPGDPGHQLHLLLVACSAHLLPCSWAVGQTWVLWTAPRMGAWGLDSARGPTLGAGLQAGVAGQLGPAAGWHRGQSADLECPPG